MGVRGTLPGEPSYDLTGFVVDTQNDFDRYRLSTRPGLTFYRNLGHSRRGAEMRVGWRPVRRFSASAAYTRSRFSDGGSLPGPRCG